MADSVLLNTAHPAGRTYLAFSRDGSYAYTGGCDSLVRIWRTESGIDEEPDTALDAEDPITALATDNDGWLSGSDDSHVRRYKKASTDLESLITRAGGIPIRSIAVDPKGRRVAVASDELAIKIIDLDETTKIMLLDGGHKRGIRSLSWHPSGAILASCGSDGKIVVWDVSDEEPKILKTLEGIIAAVGDTESTEFGYDCSAVWHNSGQYFIIANKAHDIITISRKDWTQVSTFTDADCVGAVTALALSVNGVYLASACNTNIFVWSTANKRIISRHAIEQGTFIHRLAFSPAHNLLAWTDSAGIFTRWPDVIPPTAPSPIKPAPSAGMSAPVRRQVTPLFGQDDDTASAKENVDVDAEIDADLEERDDDWIIDDLGDGLQEKEEKEYAASGPREMVSVTKAQAVFQPGSTPFQNKRRYLSFNNIGVVEVVDQDIQQIVNVEFHDQSTRKNYHFSDHYKFDLAAVGERGVIYACPPAADHPSQITYKPFSTWASHGEWTYSLPKGEKAIAVAAGGTPPTKSLRTLQEADLEGNGYVAIATDKNVIRFFSGGGVQRGPIWAVDGDIVSMVAGRDYVFVAHREGGTSLDGNQNLKYTLRTSDTFRVMHTGRLPVNKGQTLKWIGITDEGAPVVYDSEERVMMLEHYRYTSQGSWAVLLDASTLARRTGKDESYWPIGVSKSTLLCLILKGREDYPGFPRPLAQEIEMTMPYLDMDAAESQKEERLARESLILDAVRDTLDDDALATEEISRSELDLDKEIIQLIQLACKHDKLQRAIDLAKLLHNTAALDLAIKVAEFYHLPGLREKISVLKSIRQETDRLRDERDRRRDWRRAAGPVPPARDIYAGYGQHTNRSLQDATPAPAIYRPGLVAATPSAEPSPFSRKPAQQNGSASSSRVYVEDSPPPEKRKRDPIEESQESQTSSSESGVKRRAIDESSSASKPKANPFAKKAMNGEESSMSGKPNPFARKLATTKSLHKSDSFFDKVNAAETEAEKGKRGTKSKKLATKQTTLFGLPAGNALKKSSKDSESGSKENTQVDSVAQETLANEESQESTYDVSMVDEESTLSASVAVSQSQEETQVVNADETQPLDEEDGGIISWPASPVQEAKSLIAEA